MICEAVLRGRKAMPYKQLLKSTVANKDDSGTVSHSISVR